MVPDVHEREIRLLLIAPLAAAVLWIGAPLAAAEEERTLARVVYEFAVTGYCGLQDAAVAAGYQAEVARSEEHTSELQSLMRISYAVLCLKTKNSGILQYVGKTRVQAHDGY